MKGVIRALVTVAVCLPLLAVAGDGYKITGRSGVMFFVAIDTAQANNEDVYRFAVADICAGMPVCQVHYWIGKAPSSFPLSDAHIDSKLVHWQQNLNTGLRRWLVKCDSTKLFANERECM